MAALLVGVAACGLAFADDDGDVKQPAKEKTSSNWFPWLHSQTKDAKAAPGKQKSADKAGVSAKPPEEENDAARLAREQATYIRRMEVCDKLRDIAIQNQDDAFLHRVERLHDRIWNTYLTRVRMFGGKGVLAADQQILDRHLGTRSAALDENEVDHDAASRTAVRKEKP